MADQAYTKDLITKSSALLNDRGAVLSLWQELAEQCYPEMASFTITPNDGDDFASHLFSSEPLMMRRDLANAFSYLRARDRDWFKMGVDDDALNVASGVTAWTQDKTKVLRRALYDKRAGFNRSMRIAENFFAVFGNAVQSCEVNQTKDGLRVRHWNIKDCAWQHNADGRTDTLYRDMEVTARQMTQLFPEKGDLLHENVKRCLEPKQDKDKKFKVRHCMMPASDYEGKKIRFPWASVYIDVSNCHVIREAGAYEFRYVVSGWEPLPDTPYCVSPAAMTALPEARAHQALARIVQEAGEKAIDPPMTGLEQFIRGDIHLEASGITWLDTDQAENGYDLRRHGDILKPLYLAKNPGIGFDMLDRGRNVLAQAWFINKIALPDRGSRTAYEVAQLIEEHIRANVPITEPISDEMYEPMLDLAASILLRVGAFGPVEQMPRALHGRELSFSFSNPLTDALERAKADRFAGMINTIGMVKQVKPDEPIDVDFDLRAAARDVIKSQNTPAEWMRDKDEADEEVEERQKQAMAAQTMQAVGGAGQAAEMAGRGGQAIAEAAAMGQQIAA